MMLQAVVGATASSSAGGSVPYDPSTHKPVGSSGCGKASPYPLGTSVKVTGKYAGVECTWFAYVPKQYDPSTPTALIVHMHGWGMEATAEEVGAGITALADAKNFISITPQGGGDNSHGGGPWYSWNAVGTTAGTGPGGPTCTEKASHAAFCYDSCQTSPVEAGSGSYASYSSYESYDPDLPNLCGDNPQCKWTTCHEMVTPTGTGRADVGGFLPGLYDTLESQLCIDTTREFASGESNGGMMAYQLGVDLATRLAAITPEFGSFHHGFNMAPLEGVALLDLHGSQDETVPANWSLSSDGYYYTPTKDIFGGDRYSTGWLKANGCKGAGKHYPTPYDGEKELYCVQEGECAGGDVVRCAWDGGHNWLFDQAAPNGGLVTDFLLRWSKPTHVGYGRKRGAPPPQEAGAVGQGNRSEAKGHRAEGGARGGAPRLIEHVHVSSEGETQQEGASRARAAAAHAHRLDPTLRNRNRTAADDAADRPHYGNPYAHGGCRADEDKVSVLSHVDGAAVCAPKVDADAPAKEGGPPTPRCQIGGVVPVPGNGCPKDALVDESQSRAFPVCLATGVHDAYIKRGLRTPPFIPPLAALPSSPPLVPRGRYTKGIFHCVLACPCHGIGAECGDAADSHCPDGARCLRAMRFRARGVCAYQPHKDVVVEEDAS